MCKRINVPEPEQVVVETAKNEGEELF
jgi:hypothetical protein